MGRRRSGVSVRSGVPGRRRSRVDLRPVSVFSRLPVSLKLLSLPRRALATTIMAAIATRRRMKIVTRMFNVQLELQRFDLDEARPKTRL